MGIARLFSIRVDRRALPSDRLWTAPELLRDSSPPSAGTVKGDVYSFGIILQEIELRNGPWYLRDRELEPAGSESSILPPLGSTMTVVVAIIESVKAGSLLRPTIEAGDCSAEIAQLMKRCWHEEPDERPDFSDVRQVMRRINKYVIRAEILPCTRSTLVRFRRDSDSGNILDNLLKRMEQYANNLEVRRRADLLF